VPALGAVGRPGRKLGFSPCAAGDARRCGKDLRKRFAQSAQPACAQPRALASAMALGASRQSYAAAGGGAMFIFVTLREPVEAALSSGSQASLSEAT